MNPVATTITSSLLQDDKSVVKQEVVSTLNSSSNEIYQSVLNALNKRLVNREELINKVKPDWQVSTRDIFNSKNVKHEQLLVLSKATLIDSLEISITPKNEVHIFFYHKNTSTDPCIVTNAYVFGENIMNYNIEKLQQCLMMVQ